MRLNAPKKNIWWISVILGALGFLGAIISIPFVTAYAFWFMTVGFVLLALSTVLKGM